MSSIQLTVIAAMFLSTSGAMAQSKSAGCSSNEGYKAYVILDESRQSDAFREAIRKVSHPERIALNEVAGNYAHVGPNAERHPLVYLFDKPGVSRKIDSPAEFVKFMNSIAPCAKK